MMAHDEFEDLFAQARSAGPVPSSDLMARVMSDAVQMQPAPATLAPVRAQARKPGFIAQLMEALGGWPALAGLTTATVAGVWIGISPPDTLGDPLANLLSAETTTTAYLSFDGGFDFTAGEDL